MVLKLKKITNAKVYKIKLNIKTNTTFTHDVHKQISGDEINAMKDQNYLPKDI